MSGDIDNVYSLGYPPERKMLSFSLEAWIGFTFFRYVCISVSLLSGHTAEFLTASAFKYLSFLVMSLLGNPYLLLRLSLSAAR